MRHRIETRHGRLAHLALRPGVLSRLRSTAYRAMAVASRSMVGIGMTSRRLRILGYHDVPDADALRRQVEWLARHFDLVTLDDAVDIVEGRAVSERAVLITFDDGDPSVVERGQEVLEDLGAKAVLFVCPRMIDSDEPFWWQIVERAIGLEMALDGRALGPRDLTELKGIADSDRRLAVERIRELVQETQQSPFRTRQLSVDQLSRWVESGHSIGNHTWDHPTLDTCPPEEQARQIETAHAWLADRSLMPTPVFAYPNGNATAASRRILSELGYVASMLFDHRIGGQQDRLGISRLRVNVDDDFDGFVARVSGLHPMLHGLARRS